MKKNPPKDIISRSVHALSAKDVMAFYGDFAALKHVGMDIPTHQVTALIGPSGCGKSTFLRLFNRMNDYIDGFRVEGKVIINGRDIYHKKEDVIELRKEVGMVFQKPNPFPKSIFENAIYGLRIRGISDKKVLEAAAEKSLRQAALWDEVKDTLKRNAMALSGGQQQRLCIARALAVEPSIVLMDEPASALDPISTKKIEDLIFQLKTKYTIVIVTHNMQQAARVSDFTGFFLMGEMIEFDKTKKIFTDPSEERTENYITGKFG